MRLFVIDTDSGDEPRLLFNGRIFSTVDDAESGVNDADWNIDNCVLLDADNIDGGNQDSKFGGGKGTLN